MTWWLWVIVIWAVWFLALCLAPQSFWEWWEKQVGSERKED